MQDAVSGAQNASVTQKMGPWNFGTSWQRRDTCLFIFLLPDFSFKNCQRIEDLCNLVRVISVSSLTTNLATIQQNLFKTETDFYCFQIHENH